jgi:hypothetical protein
VRALLPGWAVIGTARELRDEQEDAARVDGEVLSKGRGVRPEYSTPFRLGVGDDERRK